MTRSSCHRPTRRVTGILLAAAVLMAAAGDPAKAQSPTVRLVVDYGDGVTKTIAQLPWAKGSTVLDVMNAAKNRPHGISFEYTGSGAASFRSNEVSDRAFGFSRLCETRSPESPPCRGSGISRPREYHVSPSVCDSAHINRRNDWVPDILSPHAP